MERNEAADREQSRGNSASVILAEGMHFVGEVDGFRVDLDADEGVGGRNAGASPMHLLLLSIAGCTAMDVVSILRKKREQVTGLSVEVRGDQRSEHPKVYESIEMFYRVRGSGVDPKAVERAIELSQTKYCPVIAMLGETAEITCSYEIEEEA
ncbi:MAG TPA: OsmC family protein [Rubrobacter sp.]|nr:OsmC family protein [Rubrobacter sp.]